MSEPILVDDRPFVKAPENLSGAFELDVVWLVVKAFKTKSVLVIGTPSAAALSMLRSMTQCTVWSEHAAYSDRPETLVALLEQQHFHAVVLWVDSDRARQSAEGMIAASANADACLVADTRSTQTSRETILAALKDTFAEVDPLDLRGPAGLRAPSRRNDVVAGAVTPALVVGRQRHEALMQPWADVFSRSQRPQGADKATAAVMDALRLELKHAHAEVAQLRASTSWRLTYPLRMSVNTLRFGLGVGRRIRRAMNDRGGMIPTVQAAVRIVRAEGLTGVLTRVRRAAGRGSSAPEVEISYADWIDRFDRIDDEARARMRTELDTMVKKPLISILVPVYNVPAALLREMVASVQRQIYPHWELCLADDASTDGTVRQTLAALAASESRIKVVYRPQNGHISQATNSALEVATGEFVALLDQDDVLTEHALLMVARAINANPHARMFYSDEDKLNPAGERTTPYFKPDWNIELIRAQNFFSHLGVYEAALVRDVGGFRVGFEGSQDHDLVLRCADMAGDKNIVHIPHVLYHWRMTENSTASSGEAKPYTMRAAALAVGEHLARRGIDGEVVTPETNVGYLRMRYALPTDAPLVSIIIPTRDGVSLLSQCVESIFASTDYPHFEILIVDNGSVEPATAKYLDSLSQFSNVRVIRDDSPFNYSALNNGAAAVAHGEYICLMNNDIEMIHADWLREMLSIAAQPGVGAVGARLWYPDDRLQHGGVILGIGGVAGHMHHMLRPHETGYFSRGVLAQDVSAVTAACLLIKKSVYDEVGGLDEKLAVAFNDVDFCIRVREAGYRNVWTPYAELYHHESATRGSDLTPAKRERFEREVHFMLNRWGDLLQQDPAYNPNLSLQGSTHCFAISEAPRVNAFA
ncbi:glycosyltransferase family 2 protein [Alcaligenaceae bacterium C4P045]|nr:glycosyltransferase family 2 protein [Alcaligenaceae bacterium C4P045]